MDLSDTYNDQVARSGGPKGILMGLITGAAFFALEKVNPDWMQSPEALGGFAIGATALAFGGSHSIFQKNASYHATKYAIAQYEIAYPSVAALCCYAAHQLG